MFSVFGLLTPCWGNFLHCRHLMGHRLEMCWSPCLLLFCFLWQNGSWKPKIVGDQQHKWKPSFVFFWKGVWFAPFWARKPSREKETKEKEKPQKEQNNTKKNASGGMANNFFKGGVTKARRGRTQGGERPLESWMCGYFSATTMTSQQEAKLFKKRDTRNYRCRQKSTQFWCASSDDCMLRR